MKGKIFNAQEVQAIIAGNKTMFREVIKVQPANENQVFSTVASSIRNKDIGTHNFINPKATWEQTKKFKCPYQVGQKIFCKESFAYIQDPEDCAREGEPCEIHYKADYDAEGLDKRDIEAVGIEFLPVSRMPQWASRLTLEVVNIKVERLDDITEEDCLKEGVSCHVGSEIADTGDYFDNEYWFGDLEEFKCNNCNTSGMDIGGCAECCHAQPHTNTFTNAYDPFINYWNATHKKPEEKFEACPFVWVVDFKINK